MGSAVTKALNERGSDVYALCLPNEKHLPHGEGVKVFFGDVCDIESLTVIFDNCAGSLAAKSADKSVIVIHCAGIVSILSKYNQKVFDVNVNGTKNIISLCEKYNVKKLVHISSVHAIPELPAGEVITEVDHFSPGNVAGLYAKTKAEASQHVIDYMKRGYDANIIHPSGITGPGDFGKGHITELVIHCCKSGLTSAVSGGYDFVDVRDVADGVLSCCRNGRSGECYILSGYYFKVSELLNLLQEITGKKSIKIIFPLWFARLIAPLVELYYRILNKPPLFTSYSIFTLNTNANFSREKAAKELGYAVRPMKQTLTDTIKWLKDNNRIKTIDK